MTDIGSWRGEIATRGCKPLTDLNCLYQTTPSSLYGGIADTIVSSSHRSESVFATGLRSRHGSHALSVYSLKVGSTSPDAPEPVEIVHHSSVAASSAITALGWLDDLIVCGTGGKDSVLVYDTQLSNQQYKPELKLRIPLPPINLSSSGGGGSSSSNSQLSPSVQCIATQSPAAATAPPTSSSGRSGRSVDTADAFSSGSSEKFFAAVYGNRLSIFDVSQTITPIAQEKASAARVLSVQFSPPTSSIPSLLAVGGESCSLKLLDVRLLGLGARRPLVWKAVDAHTDAVTQVAFSPGSNYLLASASRDGTVCLWDIRKEATCLTRSSVLTSEPVALQFSPWHVDLLSCVDRYGQFSLLQSTSTYSALVPAMAMDVHDSVPISSMHWFWPWESQSHVWTFVKADASISTLTVPPTFWHIMAPPPPPVSAQTCPRNVRRSIHQSLQLCYTRTFPDAPMTVLQAALQLESLNMTAQALYLCCVCSEYRTTHEQNLLLDKLSLTDSMILPATILTEALAHSKLHLPLVKQLEVLLLRLYIRLLIEDHNAVDLTPLCPAIMQALDELPSATSTRKPTTTSTSTSSSSTISEADLLLLQPFPSSMLCDMLTMMLAHDYGTALQFGTDLAENFVRRGCFAEFVPVARVLLYPCIWNDPHVAAPLADSMSVHPSSFTNTSTSTQSYSRTLRGQLDSTLNSAADVIPQLRLLAKVGALLCQPSADGAALYMELRSLLTGKKLFSSVLMRFYLYSLEYLKEFDELFIYSAQVILDLEGSEFGKTLEANLLRLLPVIESYGKSRALTGDTEEQFKFILLCVRILQQAPTLPPPILAALPQTLQQVVQELDVCLREIYDRSDRTYRVQKYMQQIEMVKGGRPSALGLDGEITSILYTLAQHSSSHTMNQFS